MLAFKLSAAEIPNAVKEGARKCEVVVVEGRRGGMGREWSWGRDVAQKEGIGRHVCQARAGAEDCNSVCTGGDGWGSIGTSDWAGDDKFWMRIGGGDNSECEGRRVEVNDDDPTANRGGVLQTFLGAYVSRVLAVGGKRSHSSISTAFGRSSRGMGSGPNAGTAPNARRYWSELGALQSSGIVARIPPCMKAWATRYMASWLLAHNW